MVKRCTRAILLIGLVSRSALATFGTHTATPFANGAAVVLDSIGVVATRSDLCPPSAGAVVTPEQFGAIGDGVANDAAALQAAVRSCSAQCTVQLGAGKWYRVEWTGENVLHLDKPNVQLRGAGTANAAAGGIYVVVTDEMQQCSFTGGSPTGAPACAQSKGQSVHLGAPNTDIINLNIVTNTRYRSAGNPRGAALWVNSSEHDICGNRLEYGSMYIEGASNYRVTGNSIFRAYQDPIHQTDDSVTESKRIGNALVRFNHIAQSGDDGVAVIDRGIANMTGYQILDNIIQDGYWGRGIGVDGGDNVTIARNTVLRQVMASSIIVHSDTPAFQAAKTTRVVVRGNTIDGNQTGIESPWHPCHSHWPGTGNHWDHFQACISATAGNIGWPPPLTDHGMIDLLGRDEPADSRPPIDSRVSDVVIEGNTLANASRGAFRVRDFVCNVRVRNNALTNVPIQVWRESYTGTNVVSKMNVDALCKGVLSPGAGVLDCTGNTLGGLPQACQ